MFWLQTDVTDRSLCTLSVLSITSHFIYYSQWSSSNLYRVLIPSPGQDVTSGPCLGSRPISNKRHLRSRVKVRRPEQQASHMPVLSSFGSFPKTEQSI